MKKILRLWTVVWKDERRQFYGVPEADHGIIPLENEQHGIKLNTSKTKIGRPKMRWAEVQPFFDSKEEAEAYRQGNEDWDTVPVQCSLG